MCRKHKVSPYTFKCIECGMDFSPVTFTFVRRYSDGISKNPVSFMNKPIGGYMKEEKIVCVQTDYVLEDSDYPYYYEIYNSIDGLDIIHYGKIVNKDWVFTIDKYTAFDGRDERIKYELTVENGSRIGNCLESKYKSTAQEFERVLDKAMRTLVMFKGVEVFAPLCNIWD